MAVLRHPVGMPASLRTRTDIALLVVLGALLAALAFHGSVDRLDVALAQLAQDRPHSGTARAASWGWWLGDGTFWARVSTVVAVIVVARTGSVAPLLVVQVAWAAERAAIGLMKLGADRGAPRSGEVAFGAMETGLSFPSGHASHAVLWFGVLAVLAKLAGWHRVAATLWWLLPLLAVATITSMVYLRFHWLTDGVGGVLLGTLVLRQVIRLFGPPEPAWVGAVRRRFGARFGAERVLFGRLAGMWRRHAAS